MGYLTWIQLACSIIATIASAVALFFPISNWRKRYKTRKLFNRIKDFYRIYELLNPYLINNANKNLMITCDLQRQSLFTFGGYPDFNFYIFNMEANQDFNIFCLDKNIFLDNFTFPQIRKTNRFWKKAIKKGLKILQTINDFNYIKRVNFFEKIDYREETNFCQIEQSSITLCPSFDNLKLFASFSICGEYKQEKVDLVSIYKNDLKFKNARKKYLKELKSDSYCVNLMFNNTLNNRDSKYTFSYSIFFENKKIVKILPFYKVNGYVLFDNLDKEIKEIVQMHKNWIKLSFSINNIDEIWCK